MAAQIAASIYGANSNDWNNSNGVSMGFPSQGIVLRALPAGTVYSGVTCLTSIQLLPTGPSPIQPLYYCPTAIATLITAGA